MLIFILVLATTLISYTVLAIGFKKNLENVCSIFGGMTMVGTALFVLIGFVCLVERNPIYQNSLRIELEERRNAIVQELNRSDTDILLKGIEDAKEFNEEIRNEQYKLNNNWTSWLHNPVYNEFEPISYED